MQGVHIIVTHKCRLHKKGVRPKCNAWTTNSEAIIDSWWFLQS